MKYRDVLAAAPATPACFQSREQWAGYLASCQELGKRQSDRPFTEEGRFRPIFNWCADCTSSHAKLMALAGKCHPSQFRRVIPILLRTKESA